MRYRHGVYGNTMTGNPRGCAVAAAVLSQITPALRKNVVEVTSRATWARQDDGERQRLGEEPRGTGSADARCQGMEPLFPGA